MITIDIVNTDDLEKDSKRQLESDFVTVGEIVASDIRKAEVFRKYNIDFCCGGKKKLSEVCAQKSLDLNMIKEELDKVTKKNNQVLHFSEWDIEFLLKYIVQNHHKYVLKAIPEISFYLTKVSNVHGANHWELYEIEKEFHLLADEMMIHMRKEEHIVFPYILELVSAQKSDSDLFENRRNLRDMIYDLEDEHENAGQLVRDIRQLSGNYETPSDSCSSFKYLYELLRQFEDDLNIHVHLENNILFPKSIELEELLTDTYINE